MLGFWIVVMVAEFFLLFFRESVSQEKRRTMCLLCSSNVGWSLLVSDSLLKT